jgi:UDP-N-acetylglucosamine/UDP-N-acetylgalactosamine diphosphorylase
MSPTSKIDQLVAKGVHIPNPQSVEIGDEIDPDRISGTQVTLHAGTKLFGASTYVADGVRIGFEGPATVQDCFVGPEVQLKGGYFQQAVFLHKASCGLGSHVRQGTILEEHASVAHTVGLKQTILFPFVTLGSLINFCDCLMAGGTGSDNHSEVGSSYIHFNFTPNQDKATPSLIGDVAQGVMINHSPIFLGGQGGLVGPLQIAYGTVIAAGSVCRTDQLKPGRLVVEGPMPTARLPFISGRYQGLKRLLKKNFHYIAQLTALRHWYAKVRSRFIGPMLPRQVHDGLVITLDLGITERLHQLDKLRHKVEALDERKIEAHQLFCRRWPQKLDRFEELRHHTGDADKMDRFLAVISEVSKQGGTPGYIDAIRGLTHSQAELGSQWLQSIVDHCLNEISSGII